MKSHTRTLVCRVLAGIVFGIFGFGAMSSSALAQQYLFNRADFNTGAHPTGGAVADFNGDGIPDLAVCNLSDDTVSILIGKPDGTFMPRTNFSTGASGSGPGALAVGDFNGDGKLDLVVANSYAGNVAVLLGNGDGTFQPPSFFAVGASPGSVAVGDFNGDGKLDLAVANTGGGNVTVLLGNGNGTFTLASSPAVGSAPPLVVVGDFNGDGKLDLAVSNYTGNSVSILLGNGDGTFQPAVNYAVGANPAGLAVGDLNGDGKLDLAVPNAGSNNVTVLLGNGDGTFTPAPSSPAAGVTPNYVVIADLNGDGKPDLAVANATSNNVSVLLGNGDGTFKAAVNYAVGANPGVSAVGNFNGDSAIDLAVVNSGSNTVSVLLGNGDGTFTSRSDVFTGNRPTHSAQGDFNGDGKLDLVVLNENSNTFSVFLGNGDGTFMPRVDYPTGLVPTSIIAGDFNNDGNLDVAVASHYEDVVSIFLGNGDGTFQSRRDFAVQDQPVSLAAGDFNGDGKLDLTVANECQTDTYCGRGYLQTFLGDGAGGFVNNYNFAGTDYLPLGVIVADFTGSGHEDLAIVNSCQNLAPCTPPNGSVQMFTGIGNGAFEYKGDFTVAGSRANALTSADFNNDGKPDVAVANLGDNTVSVLLGNGDGTLGTQTNWATAGHNYWIAAGDFNEDGKADLVTANAENNLVSILIGNGDGNFQSALSYAVGGQPGYVIAADLKGDGSLDVVTSNLADNTISVLLNLPVVALYPSNLSFASVGVGSSSAPQNVTFSNPGSAKLEISSITASGDFSVADGCGAHLVPGDNCTLSVIFTPTASGTRTGFLTIADNSPTGPHMIPLAGTATAPVATVTPTSLTFGPQGLGTTSVLESVLLGNAGTGTLIISGIAASGDFAQTNTCGGSVASGSSCYVNVTFKPSAIGARTGTLTFTDNNNGVSGSVQTVSLAGTGVNPGASLSLSSLAFGNQAIKTTSLSKKITLTSTGTTNLNISAITLSGPNSSDFAETNTCPASLAPGLKCAISVSYTPNILGAETATLNVNDDAAGSPQTAALSGTGIVQAKVSPISMIYSPQVVGTTSAAKTVTLTNSLNTSLTITSITFTGANPGDFASPSNTCGGSLAAKSICKINVTFTPTAKGTRTATLNVNDSANNSPQTVSLSGTGK